MNDGIITFKIATKERETFKTLCENKQLKISEILRQYIIACNKNNDLILFI